MYCGRQFGKFSTVYGLPITDLRLLITGYCSLKLPSRSIGNGFRLTVTSELKTVNGVLGLEGPEVVVDAFFLEQLFVVAGFGDSTFFKYQHLVSIHDRR